ncbi:MAG: polysaccharide deacetylase family protein [Betaproteobacteria bacterium]|nr:polysaccharide deacetylase family protein [Betaproteobacteria bacterium]
MAREVPVPVLTYHGVNIDGNDYDGNDHVALREDLHLLSRLGWRVAPLPTLVDQVLAGQWPAAKTVALTFDDGSDFDAVDLPHPTAGLQRSMLGILEDFVRDVPGAQPGLHATAFVIASPAALPVLDRTCLIGQGWWNDTWWPHAVGSGLMGIANHSWDHAHPTLPEVRQRDQHKGDFHRIDTHADAEAQVRSARDAIRARAPNAAENLFAYPYGHASAYLAETYFPRGLTTHDPPALAAFTITGESWTPNTDRWQIPRWVCGLHWRSPDELAKRLASLA